MIGLKFNLIEEKWDANWWKIYWNFSCEYDDGIFWHISKKAHVYASLFGIMLNKFQFGTIQTTMIMIYNLWNLKLLYIN
jgi:hypothetical protein